MADATPLVSAPGPDLDLDLDLGLESIPPGLLDRLPCRVSQAPRSDPPHGFSSRPNATLRRMTITTLNKDATIRGPTWPPAPIWLSFAATSSKRQRAFVEGAQGSSIQR